MQHGNTQTAALSDHPELAAEGQADWVAATELINLVALGDHPADWLETRQIPRGTVYSAGDRKGPMEPKAQSGSPSPWAIAMAACTSIPPNFSCNSSDIR